MRNKDKILEMFNMQLSLNNDTNGKNWVDGVTKDGKKIDWKRCIYMECLEVVDSFSWKHWKNIDKEPDWQNVKIELVDIWHFIMSLEIEQNSPETIENISDKILKNNNFNDFFKDINNLNRGKIDEILSEVEFIVHLATSKEKNVLDKMIDKFFKLCINCGVNIDILYQNYMAKNILNGFRQNNGYKEGTYIKIWNGKEDNEVLMDILKNNQTLTTDEIYEQLEVNYKTQTKI